MASVVSTGEIETREQVGEMSNVGPDNLVKGETGKRTGEVETGERTGERRGERTGETKAYLPLAQPACAYFIHRWQLLQCCSCRRRLEVVADEQSHRGLKCTALYAAPRPHLLLLAPASQSASPTQMCLTHRRTDELKGDSETDSRTPGLTPNYGAGQKAESVDSCCLAVRLTVAAPPLCSVARRHSRCFRQPSEARGWEGARRYIRVGTARARRVHSRRKRWIEAARERCWCQRARARDGRSSPSASARVNVRGDVAAVAADGDGGEGGGGCDRRHRPPPPAQLLARDRETETRGRETETRDRETETRGRETRDAGQRDRDAGRRDRDTGQRDRDAGQRDRDAGQRDRDAGQRDGGTETETCTQSSDSQTRSKTCECASV
ncbi:hypothetical protein C0Q70_20718 [Pomacea canaliculata]|uniref:Uncharacterized protein n=1 Tax=Pomacea canaliculata TaxID=400727 RepID=A0A2T7NGF7_POMCA|nr:hypothetical protein C0Q70_20718 [Pomacea canaliculata]